MVGRLGGQVPEHSLGRERRVDRAVPCSPLLLAAALGCAPPGSTESTPVGADTSVPAPTGDTGPADTGGTSVAPTCATLRSAAGVTEFALPGLPSGPIALAHDGDGFWLSWRTPRPMVGWFYADELFVGRIRCDGTWAAGPVALTGPGPFPNDGAATLAVNDAGLRAIWLHTDQPASGEALYQATLASDGTWVVPPAPLMLTAGGAALVEQLHEPRLAARDDGTFALVLTAEPTPPFSTVYLQALDDTGPLGDAVALSPGGTGNQAHPRVAAGAGPVEVAWEELVDLGTPIRAAFATVDGALVDLDGFDGSEPTVGAADRDAWRAWRSNAAPFVHLAGPGGVLDLGDPSAVYATELEVSAGPTRVLLTWREVWRGGEEAQRAAWLDRSGVLLAEEALLRLGAARSFRTAPLPVGEDLWLVVEGEGFGGPAFARFLLPP